MTDHKSTSYLMLIGSMLIFGTIGIFRRYIPVSSALLACARGFLGTAVLLLFLKIKGHKLCRGMGKRTLLLLFVIGAMIGFNWIFLFEAYNYTTVAVATLCYYMEPTIVILLSPIFFREKLSSKKLICAAISIVGMALISGLAGGRFPGGSDLKGILFGLAAAALYSAVVIMNKKVPACSAYDKTIVELFSAALVLIPYLLLTEDLSHIQLSPLSVLMILIVGVVHTGFAYAMYFASLSKLSAQSIAVLSYLDPISALILSALILHERMSVYGIIGAILIIGATLVSELQTSSSYLRSRK